MTTYRCKDLYIISHIAIISAMSNSQLTTIFILQTNTFCKKIFLIAVKKYLDLFLYKRVSTIK